MTIVAFPHPFHPALYPVIEAALPDGWKAAYAEDEAFDSRARIIGEAAAVFLFSTPVDARLIDAAPRLKLVQKLGAGYDNIDLDYCARRGVAVARLAGGNAVPVAEHTIMLMLAAYRRLPEIDRRIRAGEWMKEEARGIHRQLTGRRIGIVGLGAVGRALAHALAGFGMEIVYTDPVRPGAGVETRLGVTWVPLDELVATSDIVTLHCPRTAETENMFDAARIAAMKPGAVLVNCARGGIVDEAALAGALKSGHLFAAALDVFDGEPTSAGNPLFDLEQTVYTSHMAGVTIDNFTLVMERAMGNAARYLRGDGLPDGDIVRLPD